MAHSSDVGYTLVVIVDPSFGQVAIVVPSNVIRLTHPRGLVVMASLIDVVLPQFRNILHYPLCADDRIFHVSTGHLLRHGFTYIALTDQLSQF